MAGVCATCTSAALIDSINACSMANVISAYDLNYRCPRICPLCLRECPVWWAVWDLGLVTTCPLHRCHLLNQCPACKRASSGEFVGDGERQRAVLVRNRWNLRHVESKDIC